MNKKIVNEINERILNALDQQIIPWKQSWKNGIMNQNAISGHTYSGINELLTNCNSFSSPYWITFNQLKGTGGSIKKGEKSTPIIFFSKVQKKESTETDQKNDTYVLLKTYRVFNLDQITGFTMTHPIEDSTPAVSSCETIIDQMKNKPTIINKNGSKCAYQSTTDSIFMVNKNQFESLFDYYHVLFHELIHSTGHESRLNRSSITKNPQFGSKNYALEELIAEIGANYLSNLANIQNNVCFDQSVSYINHWKSVIQNQPNAFLIASQRAQKAVQYIQNN